MLNEKNEEEIIVMREYIVNTKSGKIKGYLREGRIEYLGIPYAKPP